MPALRRGKLFLSNNMFSGCLDCVHSARAKLAYDMCVVIFCGRQEHVCSCGSCCALFAVETALSEGLLRFCEAIIIILEIHTTGDNYFLRVLEILFFYTKITTSR